MKKKYICPIAEQLSMNDELMFNPNSGNTDTSSPTPEDTNPSGPGIDQEPGDENGLSKQSSWGSWSDE